jgi:hypothetical protein
MNQLDPFGAGCPSLDGGFVVRTAALPVDRQRFNFQGNFNLNRYGFADRSADPVGRHQFIFRRVCGSNQTLTGRFDVSQRVQAYLIGVGSSPP